MTLSKPVLAALAAAALSLALALPAAAQAADRTLSVTKHGPGTGTIESSPAGIECGPECQFAFEEGASVTLTATPGPNSAAATWEGCDAVTAGKCEVTMSAAKAVVATFALVKRKLTVFTTGPGSGKVTSSPAGIDCGASCEAEYTNGTLVVLSATPGANTEATPQWSGCGFVNPQGKCEVTMASAKSVTATFELVKHTLKVNKSGEGGGTVNSAPSGISCGSTCSAPFTHGQSVTLSATPDSFSEPVSWSGCDTTPSGNCQVTIGSARTVTASFERKPQFVNYPVAVEKAGTGEGTVTAPAAGIDCGAVCSGKAMNGTAVTLTASPAQGSVFAHWSGGGCTGAGSCTIAVNKAKTVKAVFNLVGTRTLTVHRAGNGQGTVIARSVGIECGSACSAQVTANKKLTLTAKPAKGSSFARWSGACSGTAKTCRVQMSEARSATATFAAPPAAASPSAAAACVVPKLRGKSLEQAKKTLKRAHCKLGKVRRPKAKKGHKPRLVIRSSKPGAGTKLGAGAKVAVKLGAPARKHKRKG
jgi:Divergent InlB B-repeat domain/PASTA domain